MNIYILEDQIYHQQRIENCIRHLAQALKLPLNLVVTTGKPRELLESISSFGQNQLYLLDIQLKGGEKQGFEVAQTIRARDRQAHIIFITAHSEFASITYSYRVAALDFISKNQTEEAFCQALGASIKHIYQSIQHSPAEEVFQINQGNRLIRVPFREINFIETSSVPHKLTLLTDHKRIEFYENIKTLEKANPGLFRAHKSFLVNPQRIIEINRRLHTISFPNNQTCLLSRRKVKALEKQMAELSRTYVFGRPCPKVL